MGNCKIPLRPCGKILLLGCGATLKTTAKERALFDSVARESVRIMGTDVDYYNFDEARTKNDPLYGEATERVFKGPYRVKGQVDWAQSTPTVRPEGYETVFASGVWIARKELEDAGAPFPGEGDIVRFWNNATVNKELAVDGEVIPGSGYFFNVTDIDEDGHLFDQADFVGFKMALERNTHFTPERRLNNG